VSDVGGAVPSGGPSEPSAWRSAPNSVAPMSARPPGSRVAALGVGQASKTDADAVESDAVTVTEGLSTQHAVRHGDPVASPAAYTWWQPLQRGRPAECGLCWQSIHR
jgi:hypothetical protein